MRSVLLVFVLIQAIVAHDKEKFQKRKKERRRRRRETLLKREAEAAAARRHGTALPSYLTADDQGKPQICSVFFSHFHFINADESAWYIRIKRGVMKKRRFKLPKLMRDLDEMDEEEDERGMDGRVSSLRILFSIRLNRHWKLI